MQLSLSVITTLLFAAQQFDVVLGAPIDKRAEANTQLTRAKTESDIKLSNENSPTQQITKAKTFPTTDTKSSSGTTNLEKKSILSSLKNKWGKLGKGGKAGIAAAGAAGVIYAGDKIYNHFANKGLSTIQSASSTATDTSSGVVETGATTDAAISTAAMATAAA